MSAWNIETVHHDNVYDFIDALSGRRRIFRELPGERTWAFRGHADADWKLLPRAMRDAMRATGTLWLPDVVQSEARALLDFYAIANEQGLDLPGVSINTKGILELFAGRTRNYHPYFPSDSLLSLMAWAQHYGLATRLLDWTYNARVAAYFAASEAARLLEPPPCGNSTCAAAVRRIDRLCVWAVPPLQLPSVGNAGMGSTELEGRGFYGTPDPYYEIAAVPNARNANLTAQSGLFLLFRNGLGELDPRDATRAVLNVLPLEDALPKAAAAAKERASRDGAPAPPDGRLVQITLPAVSAGQLLWVLAHEEPRITASTVYPGNHGIRLAIEERRFWKEPPSP